MILILLTILDRSWCVPTNRDENTWLENRLPRLSCCAQHSQPSDALPLLKSCWRFFILCFMDWDCPVVTSRHLHSVCASLAASVPWLWSRYWTALERWATRLTHRVIMCRGSLWKLTDRENCASDLADGALQANWHLGKTNVYRSQECAVCSAGLHFRWLNSSPDQLPQHANATHLCLYAFIDILRAYRTISSIFNKYSPQPRRQRWQEWLQKCWTDFDKILYRHILVLP